MLEEVLYQIVTLEPSAAVVRILPESPVYAAHFPGYPITPGVCLVQMGLELLGKVTGRTCELQGAKGIKFLSPVLPGPDVQLRYVFSGAGPLWNADLFCADELCAKMTFTVR